MAEPQKRNTERTRRAVLDAAMHAILDSGTGVTLAEIAESAGVSKSGLIHHFGTRDQLFVAVVKDVSEQLREAVVAELDLSENHPGKMLRAYVRALCKGGAEAAAARDFASAANWNGLYAIPAIAALLEEYDAWWSEQFAADGLSAERIQIVRRAAEGVVAAALQGGEDELSIAAARGLLLELATEGSFRRPL
ncbi:TetR family transcriptional regulator [Microbacterium sp. A196]|uniref:TetR family transcriptional regulator n=1 Tax=Microbacterium sp. A196 TaxID=3457320 RepID=UPI003FD04A00